MRFDKRELSSREKAAFAGLQPVRFQDVDAAGIVFFARHFDYVHAAYEGFLSSSGHPLAEVIRTGKWAAPIKHVEADFLAPLRFGDELQVRLVAAHLDGSDLSLGWVLEKCVDGAPRGAPASILQSVHTFVELPSFKKASVPPELVQALGEIL